ncbi:hypothetical protein DHEL01_v208398 [Diaporthe helianthi]|uniref:Uncharacterized protein n=1 Tax=Diaporthe helianthi TaxID=158607 RepID=A0A2P5HSH7_DIAHE|nr:hypothetical protein DHEL01_v208398 [Diaporthe helianthi]
MSWDSLLPAIMDAFKIDPSSRNTYVAVVSPVTCLNRLREAERKAADFGWPYNAINLGSLAMEFVDFYSKSPWEAAAQKARNCGSR